MRDYGQQNFLGTKNNLRKSYKKNKKENKKIFLIFFIPIFLGFIWGKLDLKNKGEDAGKISSENQIEDAEKKDKKDSVKQSNLIDNNSEEINEGAVDEEVNYVESKNQGDLVISKIKKTTNDSRGEYGFWVKSLYDGEVYGDNFDSQYIAASINKIPIVTKYLLGVEEGSYNLSDTYKLQSKHKEEGSGSLQYQRVGSTYTYRELLEFIGKNSDNTATNALVEKVGKSNVQEFCQERGMMKTDISENLTSPEEMGQLFADIYEKKVFRDESNRQLFFDIITNTDYEERIPKGVPDNIKVSHKIGNQIQVWSDCGVVMSTKPYVLCILTKEIAKDEAAEIVPRISELVWSYENSK